MNVLFSPLIGALYNRYAMRPFIVLGSLCLALSATIFLIITHGFAEQWAIAAAFMLLCFGVTCIIMPVQTAALSSLP
ncbi:MFS transporter, partial [Escherichia coli]